MTRTEDHTPTDEQTAIHEFVRAGKGDLLIEALAGSGKTTTLIKALEVIPQQTILMSAFNKRIAEALEGKLPTLPLGKVVHVKTFHALGLAILKKHYGQVTVDASASEELVNAAAEVAGPKNSFKLRRIAVRVLRAAKEEIIVRQPNIDQFVEVGHKHDLFSSKDGMLDDKEIELVADIVYEAYRLSLDFKKRSKIDFCDMIWAPLALDLVPPSRYQAVIIDEAQDVSYPQLMMLKKLVAPNGRLIGCGDANQAIYGWRNAVPEQVWGEFAARGATRLPLTTCFRCPLRVIEEAQELVPTIMPKLGADVGMTFAIEANEAYQVLQRPNPLKGTGDHTFVLSRNNAALMSFALLAWSKGVKFQLNAGRETLEPLFTVLGLLKTTGTKEAFISSLMTWYVSESKRALEANAVAWSERIEEQFEIISAAAGYATPNKIGQVLRGILEPNASGILFSSVHKVKGLEAPRVFLLRQTFARHSGRDLEKYPVTEEDLNIEYVAITRSQQALYWVNIK